MRDDYSFRRIVIIEDNVELREAYDLLLRNNNDYKVVGLYDDCESALKHFAKDGPEVLLVDLNLPGMSGLTGISKFKKINPDVKILVVTVHDDSPHVFDALCAGAIGYITKDANLQELILAIDQVVNGGAPMSAKIANMIVKSFHINPKTPLTDRETDVLKQLAQGKTYGYIADDLNVSKDTVKTHIRHIYEKLQVNNKSDAVIKAKKDNLV
jgi:DNA-binding NarL/FixJ family response regulator